MRAEERKREQQGLHSKTIKKTMRTLIEEHWKESDKFHFHSSTSDQLLGRLSIVAIISSQSQGTEGQNTPKKHTHKTILNDKNKKERNNKEVNILREQG